MSDTGARGAELSAKDQQLSDSLRLLSFGDRDQLNSALADDIAAILRDAIEKRGEASVVFSGGNTPATMLQTLSQKPLAWDAINVSLVDERWVPTDSADSNEAILRRCLQQNKASGPHIIGLKNSANTPELGLEKASKKLDMLHWPLDCVHLGMGNDGHTASWFADAPEFSSLNSCDKRLMAFHPQNAPHARITLSKPAILSASHIVLQIFGEEKRAVLEDALAENSPYPVSIILKSQSPVTVYWAP